MIELASYDQRMVRAADAGRITLLDLPKLSKGQIVSVQYPLRWEESEEMKARKMNRLLAYPVQRIE